MARKQRSRIVLAKRYRVLTCAICAALAAAAPFVIRPPIANDGKLLDRLLQVREIIFSTGTADRSPVAVIAVDKRSLDSPRLAAFPRVFMAPVWAELVDSLFKAGALTVGFDEILSYDANRFSPNFNQRFLQVLAKHEGHVVLARSWRTLPTEAFRFTLGSDGLGLTEIVADPDGVFRHIPSDYQTGGSFVPSFAALILRQAGAPAMPSEVLLAPRRQLESIPTFALIDVLRCAESAPEAINAAFSRKIVLIGDVLAEEDRRVSSSRYLRPPKEGPMLASCGLRQLGASMPASDTVPGVVVHAGAVEAVASGHITSTASPMVVAITSAFAAGGEAAAGLGLTPLTTAASTIGIGVIGAALLTLALFALQFRYWIPLTIPFYFLTATWLIPVVSSAVRYLAEQRNRQRIKRVLRQYLSRDAAG
jgi:CHASE2 domain-containing sensor protein